MVLDQLSDLNIDADPHDILSPDQSAVIIYRPRGSSENAIVLSMTRVQVKVVGDSFDRAGMLTLVETWANCVRRSPKRPNHFVVILMEISE